MLVVVIIGEDKVKVYRQFDELDFDYVERGGVSEITKYDIKCWQRTANGVHDAE